MPWTFANTPIATITFILTLYISHYYLDKYNQRLDHGLQRMHLWVQDAWAPLRFIFSAFIMVFAYIAKGIRALNTSSFMEKLLPGSIDDLMLNPWRVLQQKKYILLLTHGFIHANYLHLVFNMIAFWFFAFTIEALFGHLNFFLIYFGSLIIGGYISTYRRRFNQSYRSLGASGALSGILIAFIMHYPDVTILLFFIIPMKGWFFALLFLLFSYLAARPEPEKSYSFMNDQPGFSQKSSGQWAALKYKYPMLGNISGMLRNAWRFVKRKTAFIDHESHFWGAICGGVIALLLKNFPAL